jgi:hypothetical protein
VSKCRQARLYFLIFGRFWLLSHTFKVSI